MTTPSEQPVNVANDNSIVGVQAQSAHIDTIIIPDDVRLTVHQDASPEVKYRAGVENLRSGNPTAARTLIWDAMMHEYAHSEVEFHWLIAMLSGRTMKQFSVQEINQLKQYRSRLPQTGNNAWADGIRLINRLLDTVLPSDAAEAGLKASKTDMHALVKEFDDLGPEQRVMIQPHLELFLTGSLKDEIWRRELARAQSRQHSANRCERAWMFFQPVPAEVSLVPPEPEKISGADRLGLYVSACGFGAAALYLAFVLLLHGAIIWFLFFIATLAGYAVAASASAEQRFLAQWHSQKEQKFQLPDEADPDSPTDSLAQEVRKRYQRYFKRYTPDDSERERLEAAVAGIRRSQENELAELCRRNGIGVNEVVWLIRHQVCDLKQHWRNGTLSEYQQEPASDKDITEKRIAAFAAMIGAGVVTLVELRTQPLADLLAVLCGYWMWRSWLRVKPERRRYAAQRAKYDQRQEAIDEEYRRWSTKLKARPKDAEMESWLASDRTVLLGQLLDRFGLHQSNLTAYALLEQNGVAAKRAQIEDGPWRYESYRLRVLLLAEDKVREYWAHLDFLAGTLSERKRTSYAYVDIVSTAVTQDRAGQKFEFRLMAGDPITFRVLDANPQQISEDRDLEPAEDNHEPAEAAETALDAASVADVLHLLEKMAGRGRAWPGDR